MEVVRLVDRVDVNSRITNQEIRDALVVGPAVVALLGGVQMLNSTFDVPSMDFLFIPVAENTTVTGVIGLLNVTFDRCRFQNVGIIGTEQQVEDLKKSFLMNAPGQQEFGLVPSSPG